MKSYLWWTFNGGEWLKSWKMNLSLIASYLCGGGCTFFLGFAFKLHLLPKKKKRLEGEVPHRAGRQVITSLIVYASCKLPPPPQKKKKNPLQREKFTLIWSKCMRQLLYSIITSLTLHLDSSKWEVFTCSPFVSVFSSTTAPFSLSLSLSLSLSPAVSCCSSGTNKKQTAYIWHETGLFLLIKRHQRKWHSGQRLPLVIKLGRWLG